MTDVNPNGESTVAVDPGRDAAATRRRHLYELIAALDRRVSHPERAGEAAIARHSAALRREAVSRLAELDAAAGRVSSSTDRVPATTVALDDREHVS